VSADECSGYAAFLDPDVNRMLKKVLNTWGKFLQVRQLKYEQFRMGQS
jgi:hypothetical protein